MAITVAQIAARALNAVSAAIPDAVHVATLTKTTQGAYNPATGAYSTTTVTITGRAVEDSVRPVQDVFPEYIVGPGDVLVLLEGLSAAPVENDVLTYAGMARTIRQSQDIVAAGTVFYVVAR